MNVKLRRPFKVYSQWTFLTTEQLFYVIHCVFMCFNCFYVMWNVFILLYLCMYIVRNDEIKLWYIYIYIFKKMISNFTPIFRRWRCVVMVNGLETLWCLQVNSREYAWLLLFKIFDSMTHMIDFTFSYLAMITRLCLHQVILHLVYSVVIGLADTWFGYCEIKSYTPICLLLALLKLKA